MKTLREFAGWLEEEEASGSEFSLEALKSIPHLPSQNLELASIKTYLTKCFGDSIGDGTFRDVWIIDDNHIVKVAKKSTRVDQNSNEKYNADCMGPSYSIKVLDQHPRFFWLIEERVKPLTEEEFVRAFGLKLGIQLEPRTKLKSGIDTSTSLMISDIIEELAGNKRSSRYERILPEFQKSPWLNGLIKSLQDCDVGASDLHWGNWGIRPSTGELVLLDLGF